MSKAAKLSVVILGVLTLLAMAFAGFFALEKQKLAQENSSLQTDIQTYQAQTKKLQSDTGKLKAMADQAVQEKDRITKELAGVDEKIKKYETEISNLKKEGESWKKRLETIQAERDQLLVKLQEKPEPVEKIVYKYVEKDSEEAAQVETSQPPQTTPPPKPPSQQTVKRATTPDPAQMDDQYWAGVLKEKAAMDVELESLQSQLADYALHVDELKEENAHLTLELSKLGKEREAIEREIKYGKDLADTLSLELARSKSDKKFMAERMEKIQRENNDLGNQIKNLMATKIALEKTIVRLTDDKGGLEKKLAETENVIQSKIEEIWEVKKSLNDRMKKAASTSSHEIELPPIIVSANSSQPTVKEQAEKSTVGANANVISVNEENNFVIIDIGENKGINIGDIFNVYRETDHVGEIEVIQVRKDIAAADIRERNVSIKVGDSVR